MLSLSTGRIGDPKCEADKA